VGGGSVGDVGVDDLREVLGLGRLERADEDDVDAIA
jgi:hypothetical protein